MWSMPSRRISAVARATAAPGTRNRPGTRQAEKRPGTRTRGPFASAVPVIASATDMAAAPAAARNDLRMGYLLLLSMVGGGGSSPVDGLQPEWPDQSTFVTAGWSSPAIPVFDLTRV